eukprot:464836-Prymnesium_polylepis.2
MTIEAELIPYLTSPARTALYRARLSLEPAHIASARQGVDCPVHASRNVRSWINPTGRRSIHPPEIDPLGLWMDPP